MLLHQNMMYGTNQYDLIRLDLKKCICHFTEWKIHPSLLGSSYFTSKSMTVSLYNHKCFLLMLIVSSSNSSIKPIK